MSDLTALHRAKRVMLAAQPAKAVELLVATIEQEILEAVAEEREACIKDAIGSSNGMEAARKMEARGKK